MSPHHTLDESGAAMSTMSRKDWKHDDSIQIKLDCLKTKLLPLKLSS